MFRHTLRLVHCTVADALATARCLNARIEDQRVDGVAHSAFREWLQAGEGRAEQALPIVLGDTQVDFSVLRVVLTAGDRANSVQFTTRALELSIHPQAAMRQTALFALGRVVPLDDESLVARAISTLGQAVESSPSDGERAVAAEAILWLLQRAPGRLASRVEPIVITASESRAASMRRVLASGLFRHRDAFTTAMTDAVFSALRHTKATESETIADVDSLLYVWDIDGDRHRVCSLCESLFTHKHDALSIDDLGNLRHRLGEADGRLLGWYAFSFLSTANDRLCEAAAELLPYREARRGIDIDLSSTVPDDPAWILFLARKVLGYCLFKKECAAGLLMSCLRAVRDEDRDELETLILDCFLINYLDAIESFEEALAPQDAAASSVKRLAQKLRSYVRDLEELGTCPAFRPSERERHLQAYRLRDFWQDVEKMAEEQSILSLVGHKSILLYGTASIAHLRGSDGTTHRQEMRLVEHQHIAEFPRLDAIDPVALRFALNQFKSERPPS